MAKGCFAGKPLEPATKLGNGPDAGHAALASGSPQVIADVRQRGIVIPFFKYHGLGNDYLVIEAADLSAVTPAIVRRICDRHFGVGADGILLWSRAEGPRVRILNPDGSEAEKSGNGLRIFARHLYDRGVVTNQSFSVATPGGLVTCRVYKMVPPFPSRWAA